MHRSLTLLTFFVALLVSGSGLLLVAPAARADILPPPTRPQWDDPPAPLPEPPDEGAWRWVVPMGLAAAAAAAAGAALRLRGRSPARGTS